MLLAACGSPSLPNGYAISKSATNREWLQSPDGTLVYGGLIADLFQDDGRLVGVFQPATSGGIAVGYNPLGEDCLVALQIETATADIRQIRVADAYSRGSTMQHVWSSARKCLQASSSTSQ